MSLYSYSPSSPIASVQFRYSKQHPPEAIITASVNAKPDVLEAIRRTLDGRGWQNVAVSDHGNSVLQAGGFKDAHELLEILNAHGYTRSKPQVTPEKGDEVELSQQEWLQRSSLKACGWSYIVSDIALIASGLMSGRKGEVGAGAFSMLGAGALAKYGDSGNAYHMRKLSEKMGDFIDEQACKLPDSCNLSRILREKRSGGIHDFESFMRRYPSESALGLYTLSALSMAQSGIRHGKPWDVASSGTSLSASIGSVLIPEKHTDSAHRHSRKTIEGWREWVQEKPLRLAGYAYMLSGVALGMSAMKEMRANPAQKSYIFKFMAAGGYLVGNSLLMISNKGGGQQAGMFDDNEKRRLMGQAAEVIAAQPEEIRKGLVSYVAAFIAHQPEIKSTTQEITEKLCEQVQQYERNPWVARTSNNASGGGDVSLPGH